MDGGSLHHMTDEDWAGLVESLESGFCTLMLGPDAITEESDGRRVPVYHRITRRLSSRLSDPPPGDLSGDFRAVAQAYVIQEGVHSLRRETIAAIEEHPLDDPALEQLARLPFRLVVNTAPGLPIERIFAEVKPGTTSAYYSYRDRAQSLIEDPPETAPLVYHLLGSPDEKRTLVLTESELIAMMLSVLKGDPPLPVNLTSRLRDPEQTYLFVGFRLSEWHTRMLLEVLTAPEPQDKSFALDEPADRVDWSTRLYYQRGHRVIFCAMTTSELAAELAGRVGTTTSHAPVEHRPARGAATVFLCHAGEDASTAAWLGQQLRAAGFDIWLDKDSLRGGDRWDAMIARAIEEVRYVLVLQSSNLKAKESGYVFKEINLAMERQKEFRQGLQFLVPVLIDQEESMLEELREFHGVKLYETDGIARLVRDLRRDMERAAKR